MTTPAIPLPSPEQVVFFPGELLTAPDLNAHHAGEGQLRQLHHRMLHGWGVSQGLAAAGARGATSVSLTAGYAIDAAGRELVAEQPISVPVPPVAAAAGGGPVPFTLVIRWTEDDEAAVVERAGDCGAQGAVRRSDQPTLSWLDPPAVRTGLDIVLADIQVLNCRLAQPADPARRRLLNPPPTPYAASGATEAGATNWQVLATPGGQPWAACTDVDTSEAGFGDVPAYLARLGGERLIPAASSPTGRPALIDGMPYVDAAEAGRFRLVVPLVPASAIGDDQNVEVNPQAVVGAAGFAGRLITDLAWYVEWIGLQR